jgi:hypothetical protein
MAQEKVPAALEGIFSRAVLLIFPKRHKKMEAVKTLALAAAGCRRVQAPSLR